MAASTPLERSAFIHLPQFHQNVLLALSTAASYLSQRSADVILSEIRPTKLAPEALRSVNVLLDELLWMILNSARSFSTDRLKSAFAKLIPTSFGKEGLLEAEMELKLYLDRTASSFSTAKPYVENAQEFPLQPAYEVSRHSLALSYVT